MTLFARAALLAALVTAAVTPTCVPASAQFPKAEPYEPYVWMAGIVINGAEHDGAPVVWTKQYFKSKDECEKFAGVIETKEGADPEFMAAIIDYVGQEMAMHRGMNGGAGDPTFKVEPPACFKVPTPDRGA